MGNKTVEEIEKLKRDWNKDQCWNIEDTEGFQEYKEELLDYRKRCEKEWDEKVLNEEKQFDDEMEKLEIKGLYKLVMKHEKLLNMHERAIKLLAEDKNLEAYRVLMGYED